MQNTQLQLRRGSTAEHADFVGALGEVTFDTSKNTLVTHDGHTPGGFPTAQDNAGLTANIGEVRDRVISVEKLLSGEAAGSVDVDGPINATALTIRGIPVGTSTDTYWTAPGDGSIEYGGAVKSGSSISNVMSLRFSPWVDVTHPDYGAMGDGVTDDSGAINAAIIAAYNEGTGGRVYFPIGVYFTGSTRIKHYPGVSLEGAGWLVDSTRSVYSGSIIRSNADVAIETVDGSGVAAVATKETTHAARMRDLLIDGDNVTPDADGVHWSTVSRGRWVNVRVQRFRGTGLVLSGGKLDTGIFYNDFVDSYVVSNGYGLGFIDSTTKPNFNHWLGGGIQSNTIDALNASGSDGVGNTFNGVSFEANGIITFDGTGQGWRWSGCYFEANDFILTSHSQQAEIRTVRIGSNARIIDQGTNNVYPPLSSQANVLQTSSSFGFRLRKPGSVTVKMGSYYPAGTLSPSGSTGSITLTSSVSGTFAPTDVGRTVTAFGAGPDGADAVATITGYTSGTVVSATVTASFASTSPLASRTWRLDADAYNRVALSTDGTIYLGSGASAEDVQITRTGANQLGIASGDILDLATNQNTLHQGRRDFTATAGTMTLPSGNIFTLTAVSSIVVTDINPKFKGQIILVFGDSHVTIADGGNLALAGDMVGTPNDTLTLIGDGSSWYEMCRSVN